MPLFEFACKQCGHSFEKLVTFSTSKQPQACPACGAEEGEKQFSTFATHGSSSNVGLPSGFGGGGGGGGFS